MLENLGFRINVPKSNLVPSQQVKYLGFQINSKEISLTLPHKKVSELRRDCLTIIRKQPGRLLATTGVILPLRLMTRSLIRDRNLALKKYGWDTQLTLSSQSIQQLNYHKEPQSNLWPLDTNAKKITYKRSRTKSNILCTTIIRDHQRPNNYDKIRQHNCSSIFKPSRQYNIPRIKSTSKGYMESLFKLEDQNNSSTLTREIKHTSELGFKSKTHATRLATEPNDVPRPVSPCNRCIETGLAQENAMGKPTIDPYPKNIVKSDTKQSYALHYNSRVEDGTMVFPINEHSNRFSDITAITYITSPITNQSTQSPSKPKMEDVHLLNIRTKLQAKKFPEEVIKKIQEATNKSSNATIGSSINKWCVWCYERSMDPIQGPLENIIEFLNDMSNQNKAFNIIASYRTAISEIHNHIDGYQVGRHSEIAKFMIAIRKINPPPSPPDNRLDILPSLDFIVSLSANDSISILDLSQKAAFLTALGTASRPNNLQRIDLRTFCKSKQRISLEITNPKKVNILIAHGSNKHRMKKIFIDYYDDYNLCPASTMLKLLDQTQE
ncbi:30004_t:CDS:2 [Gigaspora margarita]|uniref:30004_t:CDS:1 n=1 Tax=Gigaspora margarita TaxID=4874 RepID=A0ABN7UQP9_GIGMA|nr:30004_t:CDS:2 [Gigaspora margarita]